MSMTEFGFRLHGLITREFKTVKDFAKRHNIAYSSLQGYVNGAHEPSLGKLVELRDALGCTWEELLGE